MLYQNPSAMTSESDPGPEASLAPVVPGNWLKRAKQFCQPATSLLGARLRWILLAVGVLAVALVVHSTSRSAKLRVTGHHGFRNLGVTVSVDRKPAFTDQVAGTAKKRLGLLSKVEGSFSKTLSLEPGDHVVQVRLVSAGDHFDQTRQCVVTVTPGQESTLLVSASRNGMSLQFQGGRPELPAPSPVTEYAGYFQSILLTMGGSALSAAIGFMVQDFLKSRKTEVVIPRQSSQVS